MPPRRSGRASLPILIPKPRPAPISVHDVPPLRRNLRVRDGVPLDAAAFRLRFELVGFGRGVWVRGVGIVFAEAGSGPGGTSLFDVVLYIHADASLA